MGLRAYRINKIVRENMPTINCYHDGQLLDFLTKDGTTSYGEDSLTGFEVDVERMEEAIELIGKGEFDADYKDYSDINEVRSELVKSLKRDIKWAKKRGDNYIQYDCY